MAAGRAKQGLQAVVLGLSGGIDSAVAAALAVEALGPERVLGAALPTRHSSGLSADLAHLARFEGLDHAVRRHPADPLV